MLNSIFIKVDVNQDDIIQQKEINLLSNLFQIAKNCLKGSNGNDALENQEIVELNQAIENANKTNIIDTNETTQPENYQYINIYDLKDEYFVVPREEDYSNFDFAKLVPGKYYLKNIDSFSKIGKKSVVDEFFAYKIQDKAGDNIQNWSEGLNRKIDVIRVAAGNDSSKEIIEELRAIGEKMGFTVEEVYSAGQWIEDYSIRRHDGKVLLQGNDEKSFISEEDITTITQRRAEISNNTYQGAAAENGRTKAYSKTVPEEEQVQGKSYLEGGNVLNTIQSNGRPGAVIGQESIGYTLASLRKSNPEATEEMAIQAIADDLRLSVKDITFIPQYEFHIDMCYRPMNDGEMAVPDYSAGIAMLESTDIPSMNSEEKAQLIKELRELMDKTQSILEEAETNLSNAGYKVVKVPCFSLPGKKDGPLINYMNGVGGTGKNNQTFYITNKSGYLDLDEKMIDFFVNKFGIKKVFFVSTNSHLALSGGIDCLTQEAPRKK